MTMNGTMYDPERGQTGDDEQLCVTCSSTNCNIINLNHFRNILMADLSYLNLSYCNFWTIWAACTDARSSKLESLQCDISTLRHPKTQAKTRLRSGKVGVFKTK